MERCMSTLSCVPLYWPVMLADWKRFGVISEVSISSSRNNTVMLADISHASFLRITPALKGWYP